MRKFLLFVLLPTIGLAADQARDLCSYQQAQLDRANSMEQSHERKMTQPVKPEREFLPCTIEEQKEQKEQRKQGKKPPASHTPVGHAGKNG